MMFQVNQQIISEILNGVQSKGFLTLADHYQLMDFTFKHSIDEEQRKSVNSLLKLVDRGKIKLVNK